jgi:uncharacterized phage protein gp47/JayE
MALLSTSFNTPTLDQIHASMIADYKNRFPDADASKFSDTWKRLRVIAGAVLGLHAHIEVAYQDELPDSAAAARLDRWGTILNRARKAATPSSGIAVLRCVGAPGSTITPGLTLTHTDGTKFQTNSTATVAGGGTYVDVDVLASDTGKKTNKTTGEVLQFTATPAGFQSKATLIGDLTEGEDVEDDGSYRPRVLDQLAQPGMGGNRNDYVEWALEVAGVATAYVFPQRDGLGSVDLACLHTGRGAARLLSTPEIAAVKAYIDQRRPVSVADFRVLTVSASNQDVDARVTPIGDAQYTFDWDSSPGYTVSAWNGATRTLTFSGGARPVDLAVGDRITYKSTVLPYGSGAEMIVEAFGAGAADVIITLASTPASGPPVAGNALYSGGPLVEPIRQAILAHFDSLGPARGAYASGVWEDSLRTATLYGIAQRQEGVQDTTLVAPGANVVPVNTAPGMTIELLVPRQILVRPS